MNRLPPVLLIIGLAVLAMGVALPPDTHPAWLRKPNADALSNAWPKQTPRSTAGGQVRLNASSSPAAISAAARC